MGINRNGNASEFGWQFQVESGIIAALKDINKIKDINIEGPLQDVQLRLNDGSEILIQAKSYAGVPHEKLVEQIGKRLSALFCVGMR